MLKRIARDSELQRHQPFVSGQRVKEPALLLHRSADFDDAAVIEVGCAEFFGGFESIEDPGQQCSVPACGLSVVCDSVDGVPSSTVLLPGHQGVSSDGPEIQVAVAFPGNVLDVEHDSGLSLSGFEHWPEQFPGEGSGCTVFASFGGSCQFNEIFGRPLPHDASSTGSGFGAEVHDPVGRLDHIEVVFDHDHGVPHFDQAFEHFEQFVDVVEVQAGGGFVEQVEGAAGLWSCQFRSQFHSLGFTSRECWSGLSEGEVVESDGAEGGEWCPDPRDVLEQSVGLIDRHVEHIGNRVTVVGHGQGLGVVSPSSALVTFDPHVG